MTDASRYLGVKVTEDLTWSSHISEVAGKANRTLGFLRRNFKECAREVKAATYTTMVRPVLDYAFTVWDPHQQETLEQVQRRAARYNDYTTRTPGCVTAMGHRHGLCHRHSLGKSPRSTVHCQTESPIQDAAWIVDVDTSSYWQQEDSRIRGSRRFFQERINSEVYYNSFFPRTIREWNFQETSLPLLPWKSSGQV